MDCRGRLRHALPVKLAGCVLLLLIVVTLVPLSDPRARAAPPEKQAPAQTQAPSPGAQAQQAPREPPASIPSAEISARANEVVNYLRTLEGDLEPSRPVVGIDRALPDISARLDDRTARTRETLDSGPGLATLDALVDAWQSSRVALVAWIDTLTTRAVWLEEQRQRLAELRETWASKGRPLRSSRESTRSSRRWRRPKSVSPFRTLPSLSYRIRSRRSWRAAMTR
jgi:hypothetical protein